MKRFFALCLALTLLGGVPGCDKKTEVKKTTTTTTPEGTTKETHTDTVEKSGDTK